MKIIKNSGNIVDFDRNKLKLSLLKSGANVHIVHQVLEIIEREIYEGISAKNRKRILIYNGTDEKRKFIDEVKLSKNKIIMGPSLIEGIDMKDDFARFAIIAKIPYPSLADRFVKIKSEINPNWYKLKTIQSILQSTGRIVRSTTDYGTTYFLDGSLGNLIHYNRKYFPSDFLQRIKIIGDK